MTELLGPDRGTPTLADAFERRNYGSLTREKVDLVRQIEADYRSITDAYAAAMRVATMPDDRERLQQLDWEREHALRLVLTPAEHEDYQLRTSQTAAILRNNLERFTPTEDEFRTIFSLRKTHRDHYEPAYGSIADWTSEQLRERAAAQRQLEQNVMAALGPVRGNEYYRATDPDYLGAERRAPATGTSPESLLALTRLQIDIAVRSGPATSPRSNLSPEERALLLEALDLETERTALSLLGSQQSVEAYRATSVGQWMNRIAQLRATAGP